MAISFKYMMVDVLAIIIAHRAGRCKEGKKKTKRWRAAGDRQENACVTGTGGPPFRGKDNGFKASSGGFEAIVGVVARVPCGQEI